MSESADAASQERSLERTVHGTGRMVPPAAGGCRKHVFPGRPGTLAPRPNRAQNSFVSLTVDPAPDFVGVDEDALPYDDTLHIWRQP